MAVHKDIGRRFWYRGTGVSVRGIVHQLDILKLVVTTAATSHASSAPAPCPAVADTTRHASRRSEPGLQLRGATSVGEYPTPAIIFRPSDE